MPREDALKIKQIILASVLSIATSCVISAEPDRPTLVVFDVELIDSSLEGESYGENAAETKRLQLITAQLREGLQASGQYTLVDNAPATEAINALRESARFIHDCNNCELEVAKSLGADLALVGWVQKVSNLILNLNVVIKEVQTGEVVNKAFVDIRGNTDKSWQRGTRYMLEHRLLARPESTR